MNSEVVQKQQLNVYTVMLIVAFCAITIACLLLYLELRRWGSFPLVEGGMRCRDIVHLSDRRSRVAGGSPEARCTPQFVGLRDRGVRRRLSARRHRARRLLAHF